MSNPELDAVFNQAKLSVVAEVAVHESNLINIIGELETEVNAICDGGTTPPPIDPPIPPVTKARVGTGYDTNGFTTFAASPKTLKVAPGGDDTGDGVSTPLATLRRAHDLALNDPQVEEIQIYGHAQFTGKWVASGFSAKRPLRLRGMDSSAAIGAFLVDKRPADNLALLDLTLINFRMLEASSGLLFESCRMEEKTLDGLVIQGGYPLTPSTSMTSNLNIRFCVFAHNARVNGKAQGLFMSAVRDYVIEYCVFDGNGWVVDTGRGGSPSPGEKVRSHDMYSKMPSDDQNVVRYNIFSRGASHGIHYRTGGVLEGNLFLRNPIACQLGYAEHLDGGGPDFGAASGRISRNVAIGSDDIAPGNPRGSFAILSHVDGVVVNDNLLALNGTSDTNSNSVWFDKLMLNNIHVTGNKAYDWAVNPLKGWNKVTNSSETNNQWSLTEADLADVNKVKHYMSDSFIDDMVMSGFTSQKHAMDTLFEASIAIEG